MSDRLSFSVIVPTYNRQTSLRTCLQSLTRQNYPKSDFEVIVVDDASIPPVQDSIRAEFQAAHVSLLTKGWSTDLNQDPTEVIETRDWVKVNGDAGIVEVTKK